MAIVGVIFGISSSIFSYKDITFFTVIGFIFLLSYFALCLCFIIEVIFLLLVIFPRIKTPDNKIQKSPIFYEHISKMDKELFLKKIDLDLSNEIKNQIIACSNICVRKHKFLNLAFKCFSLFIAFMLICFICAALI
jgi:hypothetical protein